MLERSRRPTATSDTPEIKERIKPFVALAAVIHALFLRK